MGTFAGLTSKIEHPHSPGRIDSNEAKKYLIVPIAAALGSLAGGASAAFSGAQPIPALAMAGALLGAFALAGTTVSVPRS